ncbi:SPOR domain-containing protein [Luteimonas mephitis]|uniref:SPOR domain-containing protein n=1 Tax=Luteimonas mephitis TaxID=83615 RepID=UPI000412D68E|nr:SPOR domain-containing protein [Luteimonas mephitis]
MAARRGKSQARRNSGNSGGLPGWAWLVLGIVIALLAVLTLPRLLKSDGNDGFILPRANPDAQPSSSSDDDADLPAPVAAAPKPGAKGADDQERQYDFYTVLPGQEVAMSDAELAASARAEAARKQQLAQQQQAAAAASDDAAMPAPIATTPAAPAPSAPAAPVATNTDTQAPYILQAGAFGASGDAEAVKARIALLGLNARVESASIDGKTIYRVRMGPYGTATELAAAKGKLANGGLPAMAIKVK